MKRTGWKLLSAIMLAVLFLGILPITAYAASPADVVIGNSYTLPSGDVLNDDLFIIGGNANLMSGSTINGTVFLVGGSLDAAGTVNGDIVIFGGTLHLADTFVLHGDLITAGTYVNRDPAAQILGQTFQGGDTPNIILPGGLNLPNFTNNFTNGITSSFTPMMRVGGFFVRLFLWALVAMVVAMFIPNQSDACLPNCANATLHFWRAGLPDLAHRSNDPDFTCHNDLPDSSFCNWGISIGDYLGFWTGCFRH